eukprot:8151312-Pyramimonas_sp.AAC.1
MSPSAVCGPCDTTSRYASTTACVRRLTLASRGGCSNISRMTVAYWCQTLMNWLGTLATSSRIS